MDGGEDTVRPRSPEEQTPDGERAQANGHSDRHDVLLQNGAAEEQQAVAAPPQHQRKSPESKVGRDTRVPHCESRGLFLPRKVLEMQLIALLSQRFV